MPKNQLVQMMRNARNEGYVDGLWVGLQLGTNITVISANHALELEAEPLARVFVEAQRIVDDIVDVNDPEVTEAHIRYEIQRIFGREAAETFCLRPKEEEEG